MTVHGPQGWGGHKVNRSISPRAGLLAAAVLTALGTTAAPAVAAPAAGSVSIADIHGSTFDSPYDGRQVTGVPGVVTAVATAGRARGFYFQEERHGGAGCHGLLVFTGLRTPDVRPGDKVLVSGTVEDYYPDAAPARSVDLPVTEISRASWSVLSSGNTLPAPLRLRQNTVPRKRAADAGGGSIEQRPLRPHRYALDFFKAHESELIEVDNARVVGPTDSYGELYVTDKPHQNRTARGGTVYTGYDRPNTGRIEITALAGAPAGPQVNVGDVLRGATTGPLSYSQFGGYEIAATHFGTAVDGGITPEVTRKQRQRELAVATYNVENLSPKDDASKFARLATGVVHNLASPDILSLEEIQDNDGPTDDGVVAADATLREFTGAIVAAGGPRYAWREIDPVNDADGGQPGGNIRNVFLFNPQRVSFMDVQGGGSATPVSVIGTPGHPALSASPGRIAPENIAWRASRKPLVAEFGFHGRQVFVIGNHFDSKGGDQPMEGRYQPPARGSEVQRQRQATLVHDFAARIERLDRHADIVTLGDLNDYQFSPVLATLTSGHVLIDLIDRLPLKQRYSYVYEGNSQVLDHILTSPGIHRADYDVVHINSEFADQASDHDPQVLRFSPQ
ncbi:MAG: endonuclease/exonuclease/phosphatase family protein [Sciscionella sp.]